jgi:fatty acid desaturase
MHEGAHLRLGDSRASNDRIGQYLVAGPIFLSLEIYRRSHLQHHRAPLAESDPDLSLTGGYPVSRTSFARKFMRDLFGISYLKFIRAFFSKPKKVKENPSAQPLEFRSSWIPSVLVSNGLIFAILFSTGHPAAYFWFWLLPAMTLVQVFLRIRGIAEHAGYQPNPDQRLNSRSVVRRSWQTLLWAPLDSHFHIEHHLYPSVPFYRLSELHRILDERGFLPKEQLYLGYGPILKELVR